MKTPKSHFYLNCDSFVECCVSSTRVFAEAVCKIVVESNHEMLQQKKKILALLEAKWHGKAKSEAALTQMTKLGLEIGELEGGNKNLYACSKCALLRKTSQSGGARCDFCVGKIFRVFFFFFCYVCHSFLKTKNKRKCLHYYELLLLFMLI